jgi:hypothetical protein
MLFIYSSAGMAEVFNQQIEEFDRYISVAPNLNWDMGQKPTPLKSTLITPTSAKLISKDQKSINEKPDHHYSKFGGGKWLHLTKNSAYYYKVINKGQRIENTNKKNITFKIELINVTAKGSVSVITDTDYTEEYKKLPDHYKKIITLTGVGGKSLMVLNNNLRLHRGGQRLYRIEVLRDLITN